VNGINGTNGHDGAAGRDGIDGKDADVTALRGELMTAIYDTVSTQIKALPPPESLTEDEIASTVSDLCVKSFAPYLLAPVRIQKRVIRNASGQIESVVEEPVTT
jgi:hypothetical protein